MRSSVAEIIYKTTFICVLLILSFNVSLKAQNCDPFEDPDCTPTGDDDPDDVPIDGGASILIAAGVAYGLKKAYNKRNTSVKEKANH